MQSLYRKLINKKTKYILILTSEHDTEKQVPWTVITLEFLLIQTLSHRAQMTKAINHETNV